MPTLLASLGRENETDCSSWGVAAVEGSEGTAKEYRCAPAATLLPTPFGAGHCATDVLHLLRSSVAQLLPAMCPTAACHAPALAGPRRPPPSCLPKHAATAAAPQHLRHEVRRRTSWHASVVLHGFSGLAASQRGPPADSALHLLTLPLLWPHTPPPAADAHRMFSPWEPVLTAPNRTMACQRLRSFVSRPYEHPLLPSCSLAAGRFVGDAAPAVLRLFAGTCAAAEASPPGAMTEGEAAIDSKLYLLRGRACTLVRQHGAGPAAS